MMNFDILVPITFLIVLLFVARTLLAHREQRRRELHRTLRTALEQGEHVSSGLLARLAIAADPRRADLRKSIVLAIIAALVVVLGMVLPFDDARAGRVMLASALIPGLLAATYLAFWKFWYRGADDSSGHG